MKKILLAAMLSCCLVFTSCEVFKSITNQLQGLANLANCTYALKNVSNLSVAGVNVKNITNGNISAADVVKIGAAIVAKRVPLSMDLNIDITNPTQQAASLTSMDWIMEIDGRQMAAGATASNYQIPAGRTTAVPLCIATDIYELFSKDGTTALTNFIKSFSSDGTSSKVAVKIKPSVNIGGVNFPAPNYITLEKNTGSNNNNNNTSTGSSNTNLGNTSR